MKPPNCAAPIPSTPDAGSYRVEVLETEGGNEYQVVRGEPVARFDNADLAAFLVELLQEGRSRG